MICVRRLPNLSGDSTQRLYLTFDDGPHSECTSAVLNLLSKHGAHATFFVIGERAMANPGLISRILEEGHAIGNHSLDHRFRNFFTSRKKMHAWVGQSERNLKDITKGASVGFRSPAGVRTPPLNAALQKLKIPLIHWAHRFYDTRFCWTEEKALRAYGKMKSGDIVLLHDTHEGSRREVFLKSLDAFLAEGNKRGFKFEDLNSEILRKYLEEVPNKCLTASLGK